MQVSLPGGGGGAKNKGCCPSWIYPGSVVLVTAMVYAVFLFIFIIPSIERANIKNDTLTAQPAKEADPHSVDMSMGQLTALTICFHILFVLFVWSYLRTAYTPPGYIPPNAFWREGDFVIKESDNDRIKELVRHNNLEVTYNDKLIIWMMPVVERKQSSGKFRYCKLCTAFKPDRSHHCSVCGKCILRMDHHCPWVNNCVGFSNYKYFLLLLFYAVVTLGFVVGALVPRLLTAFRPVLSWTYFFLVDLPVCLIWLMSLFLFGALAMFFWYHLSLVYSAVTTIEWKEKYSSKDEEIKRRWSIAHTKYDQGPYENFRHVLGDPWLWLLPVDGGEQDAEAGTYRWGPNFHRASEELKKRRD